MTITRTIEGREGDHLVGAHVADALERILDQLAEDHPAIEPEHVGGTQDHAGRGEEGDPARDLEDADDDQDLADEAAGAGQADRRQHEQHEHGGVDRHHLGEAAIGVDLAAVDPVVDDAHHHEESGRDEAVAQHGDDAALDPERVWGEQADGDDAHVRHGRVGDQLLHVALHQGDQRGVDDRHDREREDERREVDRGLGQHRQREAQEAVAAELEEHARQQHRARRRRLDVRVGQPGVERPHRHLDRERGEHRDPEQLLHVQIEAVGRQPGDHLRDLGGVGVQVDHQNGDQEQDRAQERVEEELERGVDPARPAPDADDQVHRDQDGLEEQVEQHGVQRHEHADHQRIHDQERDHVFLHPGMDRMPGADHHDHGQQGRQQDEPERDAVDAEIVADAQPGQPRGLLDQLEARLGRIEIVPHRQRQHEGQQRGPQGDAAAVLGDHLRVAAQHRDQHHAHHGQEGDEGEKRPVAHIVTRAAGRGTR